MNYLEVYLNVQIYMLLKSFLLVFILCYSENIDLLNFV